jgi:LacI family transcriptional regulator
VGGAAAAIAVADRLAGWRDAVGAEAAAGELVRLDVSDESEAARAAGELLRAGDPATAIAVLSGRLAPAVLRAAAAVPSPPHVLLFDRLPLADLLPVPVWTVDHDPAELGRRGAELLLDRLDGNAGPARRIVVRAAVVPPRGL